MDPVINKLNTTLPDAPNSETTEQPGKSGASKFDKVRSQLKDNAGSEAHPTSPQAPANPAAVGNDAGVDRARLQARVESTPGANSISGLQNRLTSIEHQYTRLDAVARAMPANASPQQWIALQQQVYSMNESIGVLSKMVTQAASGVKSVLQTQV